MSEMNELMVMEGITLKGGGAHGHINLPGAISRLRWHSWTDTTDDVPRTDGRGGGLDPNPPSKKEQVVRWAKFISRQLKKEAGFVKEKLAKNIRSGKKPL